jgi:hypothetical protein
MHVMNKRFGLINTWNDLQDDGIEELLYPSFFMGQELSLQKFSAVWGSFLDRGDGGSKERRKAAAKEIGLDHFKNGQFAFQHQHGGTACLQTILYGIFLPLNTCRDSAIGKRLQDSISHISPPEVSGFPMSVNLQAWTKAMAEIGPLAVTQQEHAAQEALIRLSDPEETYPWLKQQFRYVTEFSGPDAAEIKREWDVATGLDVDPTHWWDESPKKMEAITLSQKQREQIKKIMDRSRTERRISQTAPLPWKNIDEFAIWLSRGDDVLKVTPQDIRMALVWFNSD